jgi:hypothetical protein
MSDNKKLNHNYVNSNGISQEHIFYKKYLIYKLKYKKLLKQLEKTAGANKIDSQIGKLLWEQIEPVELNQSNPIALIGGYSLFKNGKTFELIQNVNNTSQSKFDEDTWKNHFEYLRHIVSNYPSNSKKICVLGFGLGGLLLELSLNPNVEQIDGVDIDYVMFRLFKSIITSKPHKLNYYLIDAREFIIKVNDKYDVIVDDTFGIGKIEVDYNNILPILNTGGILYINIHSLEHFNNVFKPTLQNFSHVQIYPVGYGYIAKCVK